MNLLKLTFTKNDLKILCMFFELKTKEEKDEFIRLIGRNKFDEIFDKLDYISSKTHLKYKEILDEFY